MFCLQPPIPKIPTIILAVIPIPEDLKANDLIVYTWKVITGLLDLNIKVISYATDGGTVDVRRHVRIRKLYDTARLRATVARDQTARVRSKQLRSAIFGLWVEYA